MVGSGNFYLTKAHKYKNKLYNPFQLNYKFILIMNRHILHDYWFWDRYLYLFLSTKSYIKYLNQHKHKYISKYLFFNKPCLVNINCVNITFLRKTQISY